MLNQKIRYTVVADLLRSPARGAVLEVGSGSHGLGRYFPRVSFTGLDLDFTDYGGAAGRGAGNMAPVRADARRMPFRDGSFDLVFSLDMLEHVSPGDRPEVVREMARVARRRVVAAFPCGRTAQAVERRLAALLRSRSRPVPGWLLEHAEIDFPMPGEMDRLFASLGHPFAASWNEGLPLYRLLRRAESLGRAGRILDRVVPFALLRWLDRQGPPAIRRVYRLQKGPPARLP